MARGDGAIRLGLIGFGPIGQRIAAACTAGEVARTHVSAVLTRSADLPNAVHDVGELVAASDVVVEAAGHAALREHGPSVVQSGVDLIVLSVGALVDEDLSRALEAGPGRVEVSSGALGGLDVLRAAALSGGLATVTLTTTKASRLLIEPWMDAELQNRLMAAEERIVLYRGPVREALPLFPRSINVAATLALATLGLDDTLVEVVADPAASMNSHVVVASGTAGDYEIRVRHRPDPTNPRTSAVTANAVLRRLSDRAGGPCLGV